MVLNGPKFADIAEFPNSVRECLVESLKVYVGFLNVFFCSIVSGGYI